MPPKYTWPVTKKFCSTYALSKEYDNIKEDPHNIVLTSKINILTYLLLEKSSCFFSPSVQQRSIQ